MNIEVRNKKLYVEIDLDDTKHSNFYRTVNVTCLPGKVTVIGLIDGAPLNINLEL